MSHTVRVLVLAILIVLILAGHGLVASGLPEGLWKTPETSMFGLIVILALGAIFTRILLNGFSQESRVANWFTKELDRFIRKHGNKFYVNNLPMNGVHVIRVESTSGATEGHKWPVVMPLEVIVSRESVILLNARHEPVSEEKLENTKALREVLSQACTLVPIYSK